MKQCAASDPNGSFVKQVDFVSQEELLNHLVSADLFVFASSCENMPVTLVEAMAIGLLHAQSRPCRKCLPMVVFTLTRKMPTAVAIEQIIQSPALRLSIAQRAKTLRSNS
jgi:hypothetical protein